MTTRFVPKPLKTTEKRRKRRISKFHFLFCNFSFLVLKKKSFFFEKSQATINDILFKKETFFSLRKVKLGVLIFYFKKEKFPSLSKDKPWQLHTLPLSIRSKPWPSHAARIGKIRFRLGLRLWRGGPRVGRT